MRAPSELQMLAKLRARGEAPTLEVWITNNRMLARNLTNAGLLAIIVVSDHWECDWSALAGLDVVISTTFENSPAGTRLAVAIREHHPDSLHTWQPGSGYCTMALAPCAPMDQE